MDPIADMLTSLRNAAAVRRASIVVPYSGVKARIAELLLQHSYLEAVREQNDEGKRSLELVLSYLGDTPAIRSIRRLSTPGLRLYRKATDLPKPRGGFGIVVVSTPHGLMTTDQARRTRTGGELICEVLS